jgi:type VI secretion system protein ImpF
MSRLIPGGAIPLFDKLDQRAADADAQGDALSVAGVEASVLRELRRLLNSRSRLTLDDFLAASLTVLDYGIPDYSARSAQSEADRRLIAAAIMRAIEVFEPRVADIDVKLVNGSSGKTIALFAIAASIRVAQTVRRINFTLATGEYLAPEGSAEAA